MFAETADVNDAGDISVAKNFEVLKEEKLFSASVPGDLGGGGVPHSEMCDAIRELAGYCGSTALSFSMHQHIVLAQVWNHLHGNPGKAVLEKVAGGELVLISTGGRDWLESNGTMEQVEGGYHVSAFKAFASGCPAGNVLVTSAQYDDPKEGEQALHFPVLLAAKGVTIKNDWRTMGMRATGSNSVVLEKVFVPEGAIVARRPRGVFNPMWCMIATVALPVFMGACLGVAEKAAAIARQEAAKRKDDPAIPYLLGEMENSLTTAQIAHQSMVAIADDCNFENRVENASAALVRKTIMAKAVREAADKALEAAGRSTARGTAAEQSGPPL